MKLYVALFAGMIFSGCKPAESPGQTLRSQVRGVLLDVAYATRVADQLCAETAGHIADAGKVAEGVNLAMGCASAYDDARAAFMAAQSILDAWDDSSAGKVACAISDGTQALQKIDTLLKPYVTVPAAIEDGIAAASWLGGMCIK